MTIYKGTTLIAGQSAPRTATSVTNQNTLSPLEFWAGTQAQYDEIGRYFAYTYNGSTVYVRQYTPTTSSQVYSGIDTTSALTISSVGDGTITLSDTYTYFRNPGFDLLDSSKYDAGIIYNVIDGTAAQQALQRLLVDMNGKADKDAGNLTAAGKSFISELSMPSSIYDTLVLGASGTTYTAPANGWVWWGLQAGGLSHYSLGNNNTGVFMSSVVSTQGYGLDLYVPVRKGDTFITYYQWTPTVYTLRFVYAEGEI